MKVGHGYLIIGAGIAGLTAAMSIRNHDKSTPVTLINGEPYPPYKRTNLSKFLASGFEPNDFTLANEEDLRQFYGIALVQDTICKIDYTEKLAIGEQKNYAYEYLILATGANYELQDIFGSNFPKQKIRFYRNKSETFALQEQFADLEHIAVLGGGVQGIETCYELLKRGKKVSLIDSHSMPLWRLRSPYISIWLRRDLEARGVDCHWQQRIESVSTSIFKGLELIICCVGTKPRTALFPQNAVPEPNLMLAPDIFACGDNFCYPSESPERCHLWHEAMDLGQLAGSNAAKMAGGLSPAQLPKLQRKPYRTKIEVAGKVLFLAPSQSPKYRERHFLCKNGYYQFFLKPTPSGEQLTGAALLCEERDLLKPLQQAVWDKLDLQAVCETLGIPKDSEFDGQFHYA